MDSIKYEIDRRIRICLANINTLSSPNTNAKEAEAIYYLVKAREEINTNGN